jgi:hypothetical protein
VSEKDDDGENAAKSDEEESLGDAKVELFEAIDHFKNAASILFNRAASASEPTLKNATKEAERVAKKVGDAAEPLAKQLTGELGRLTKDVMQAVQGGTKPKKKKKKSEKKAKSDEEE